MKNKIQLKKKPPKITKTEYGQHQCQGYILSLHFFDQWRERVRNTPDEKKIARQAIARLNRGTLIKSTPQGEELKESNGLVFAIQRDGGKKIVKTIMLTFEYHRILETEYYEKNKDFIDSRMIPVVQ